MSDDALKLISPRRFVLKPLFSSSVTAPAKLFCLFSSSSHILKHGSLEKGHNPAAYQEYWMLSRAMAASHAS